MNVSSYKFCSKSSLLEMTRRHARGHGVTHHAAYKQQENHGDEQGAAHR